MKYNMNTLTRDGLVQLIKSGDDSHDNQIRVKKDGTIYLSSIVGAEEISDLRFRLETYDAGNGYVGEEAAANDKWIDKLYEGLTKAWKSKRTGYIDYWE